MWAVARRRRRPSVSCCRPLSQRGRWALARVHCPLPPAPGLAGAPSLPQPPSLPPMSPLSQHEPLLLEPPLTTPSSGCQDFRPLPRPASPCDPHSSPDSTHWADGDTEAREGARVTQSDLAAGVGPVGGPCPKPETNAEIKARGPAGACIATRGGASAPNAAVPALRADTPGPAPRAAGQQPGGPAARRACGGATEERQLRKPVTCSRADRARAGGTSTVPWRGLPSVPGLHLGPASRRGAGTLR